MAILVSLVCSISFGFKEPADLDYESLAALSDDDFLQEASWIDDLRVHGGVSYVSSYVDFRNPAGERSQGAMRGVSFNVGIDLFSKYWIAEGVLINYPQSSLNNSQISSNGFSLRLLYETPLVKKLTLRAGAGIANRGINIKAKPGSTPFLDHSYTSGATALFAGVDYWASDMISAGVELGHHMPMENNDHPTSFDLAVRLGGHF